ncbi:hypothetical protein [Brevundimonas sp.]|jgi:hypothetical protein|uniref:hypothetical protein n=1 Tax=Brevundimonas sp. TaxID=1871086 RepID=UPI00391BA9BA
MDATAAAIFNETNRLGGALWAKSTLISGTNSSPKMVSTMLFRRLWSHHRGYALLFNDNLNVDADILLRASIEASICIAANYHLPDGLWLALKQDALHTVLGHVKQFRDAGDMEMVKAAEATCRWISEGLPSNAKGKKLEMKDLADAGKVPILYHMYKALSGMSSHVSGLSIMRGVVTDDGPDLQDDWTRLNRQVHPVWQAVATLQGCFFQAIMLEENGHLETCVGLLTQVNACLDSLGFGY